MGKKMGDRRSTAGRSAVRAAATAAVGAALCAVLPAATAGARGVPAPVAIAPWPRADTAPGPRADTAPRPRAHTARVLSVRDEGRLRFVRASGSVILDEGSVSGSFPGWARVPSPDGYLHVLVYASGVFPVYAQVVLTGVLLPGRLSVSVPPIPSLPAAPNVVVVQMRLTLGGALTYYEQVGGRSVAYHPAGVGLPARCPAGGFGFAATFAFVDGSRSNARTSVPCPRG
jgi:hypothetical protein